MNWNWNAEKTARWVNPAMEIPWLAKRWKNKGFQNVLDNGCGPGRHAICFAKEGLMTVGFDKSEEALAYLTKWAQREELDLVCVQGDISEMPFEDESFDGVLDYNASYHTDTPGFMRAVSEICRVLKPGGELYITLLSQNDSGFLSAAPEAHIDEFTLAHSGSTPHFYGKKEALGEIFAGFRVENLREIRTAAIDSGEERTHFHILLQKL